MKVKCAQNEGEVCPKCARQERTPDHSEPLQRTMTESPPDCRARISGLFRVSCSRTENPGVGGSIPSLPTSFF